MRRPALEVELGGVAPGRSLPGAIPRKSPRFRDRTAEAVRASLDVVDVVLLARAEPHVLRTGGVLGLAEVLRGLRDDVDWKFEV